MDNLLKQPFRILFAVDHAKGISGPHRNVVGTLNALAKREDIFIELVTGDIDSSQLYAKAKNFRITLGFKPKKVWNAAKNIWLLRKRMREVDICYVPTNLTTFLYVFLTKGRVPLAAGPNVTGIPLIMDMANPSPIMTTKMCQAWIVNSEIVAHFAFRAGTPREKIDILLHSIDTDQFSPEHADRTIWKKYGIEQPSIIMLHVGRADKYLKGLDVLVYAFEKATKQCHELCLVYVGKPGPFLPQHILKHPNFRAIGPIYGKELSTLYASADFFAGVSTWETFWFTPLEAMASGLPVIVSNVGVVAEMVPVNGVQGIVVNVLNKDGPGFCPDAADILANAMMELARDPGKRIAMGAAARERAVIAFSPEKLTGKLVDVLKLTAAKYRRP